ncbi:MAG: helix-turn-helix domain-containing protein [Coriobacteriia bacterium]|nr:helix-turn-helix domain-containing protein [Coriobacteriia bacterium]MCL2537186.1 helix-turn-helix domain-containing protein [Coriobacteriia bacterium]
MSNTVGDRIQFFLTSKGMTQKELSQATGLTEAAVSRYVNNEREPRIVPLTAIAKVLEVTTSELLGEMVETPDFEVASRLAVNLSDRDKKNLIFALMQSRD